MNFLVQKNLLNNNPDFQKVNAFDYFFIQQKFSFCFFFLRRRHFVNEIVILSV